MSNRAFAEYTTCLVSNQFHQSKSANDFFLASPIVAGTFLEHKCTRSPNLRRRWLSIRIGQVDGHALSGNSHCIVVVCVYI